MYVSSAFQCIFIIEMPLFKGFPCHSWRDPFAQFVWILVSCLSPRATLHHPKLLPPHLHCHGHLSVVHSGRGTLDTCCILSWLLKFCPFPEGPQLCRQTPCHKQVLVEAKPQVSLHILSQKAGSRKQNALGRSLSAPTLQNVFHCARRSHGTGKRCSMAKVVSLFTGYIL